MRIDALVGGANSKTSGSYLRDIRGKNVIDEIIPLKVIAKSYPLRNVSNDISHNQMSFIPTGSAIIHGGLAKGMRQGLFLPVSSRARQTVKSGFQFQEEIIGNNSGRASGFNPTDFSYNMDAKKVYMLGANANSHKDLQNSHVNLDKDYCDIPTGRELILYGEGGSQSKLLSAANRNNDLNQNHTWTAPEPIREGIKSSQHPAVIPRSTPRKRAATESSSSDRLRRARKTENLKALRELLPHSRKGTILAVTEELIDYIKYLQLQIKVLTQSRLGGEPTFDPFIHLEGFGHYLLHDQMLNEPLEMTIGRMMEGNMSVVTQLLETKGLYVMPMPSEPGP